MQHSHILPENRKFGAREPLLREIFDTLSKSLACLVFVDALRFLLFAKPLAPSMISAVALAILIIWRQVALNHALAQSSRFLLVVKVIVLIGVLETSIYEAPEMFAFSYRYIAKSSLYRIIYFIVAS